VCPPPAATGFVGNNCFGPVATPCFGMGGENNKYNMDTEDRAPLPKGSAIWECANARGHLASPFQLTEAIQKGIGTGSGQWLHTSDDVNAGANVVLSWTVPAQFAFRYNGNVNAISNSGQLQTARPFRCVGPNFASGTHPATVPNEWTAPVPGYKGETRDSTAVGFAAALDACWNRGGHLPTATESGELALLGLTGGTNVFLWTSDQTGHDGVNFTVAVARWNAAEPPVYAGGADYSWAHKHEGNPVRPHRCVYYPVDAAYNGPQPASCSGGCSMFTLPGTSGAKMWLDGTNRAAAPIATAIDTCRQAGGHLPSERDLAEAIRHGLAGGAGPGGWIYAAELEMGNSAADINIGVVQWTQTTPAFDDSYPTYSTWVAPYEPAGRPFRCFWTNELR
jgi:hypothetical protein